MLSRTADHLFWMARYTERAENTARMLDVRMQFSLMPQTPHAAQRYTAFQAGVQLANRTGALPAADTAISRLATSAKRASNAFASRSAMRASNWRSRMKFWPSALLAWS